MLSEKQVQPVVQYALNRDLFKVPGEQWLREVEIWNPTLWCHQAQLKKAPKGRVQTKVILDLVVLVHSGAYGIKYGAGEFSRGFHGIEVKLSTDKDKVRLERQMVTALAEFDYTWLCVVDGDPVYPDERVGLVRYDLASDCVTVIRSPVLVKENIERRERFALSVERRMNRVVERAHQLLPKVRGPVVESPSLVKEPVGLDAFLEGHA